MVVGIARADSTHQETEGSGPPLSRGFKVRIAVAGAVFAAAPWGLLVAMPGLFPFLLAPVYFVTAGIVPFLVSVSHPLGNRRGARVGLWVVLTGLVWFVVFMVIMSAYKLSIYLGRPFFVLLITGLFLPLLIPLAMFAGSVGGYVPEDTATDEKPGNSAAHE